MSLFAVDGCKNYTVLSEADRAQGHIVINASSYRCDRNDLVPGWYRFQGAAGDRMANKCVPIRHCGTYHPGWLNGAHPTVAEGVVTRRVCYHNSYNFWHRLRNCCRWSNNIRVRNCGAFFVYELQNPPVCNLRYCGNGSAGNLSWLLLWVWQSTISHQAIIIINHQTEFKNILQRWFNAILTFQIQGDFEVLRLLLLLVIRNICVYRSFHVLQFLPY